MRSGHQSAPAARIRRGHAVAPLRRADRQVSQPARAIDAHADMGVLESIITHDAFER
jgi:hypothetical protein